MARARAAQRFCLRALTTLIFFGLPATPAAAASPPDVPTQLTADGKDCSAPRFVPTLTPTLRARLTDPDQSDTLRARFEWDRVGGPVADVLERGPYGNGSTADATLPAGVLDKSETIVATADWNLDGRADVLARSGDGLYLFPNDGTKLGERVQLGTGWAGLTVAGLADQNKDGKLDVIARDGDDLYAYPAPSLAPRVKLGSGFGGLTFAGIHGADLYAKDGAGVLWRYPNLTGSRAFAGAGWRHHTFIGVADRTGDGLPDLFSERDGVLWLSSGPYFGTRYQLGTGWAGVTARTIAGANGVVDVIAQARTTWQLHPGVIGSTPGGQPRAVANVGLTEAGTYVYRVSAGDGTSWSAPSSWCEFTVDITAPAAPVVTGDVYKPSGCAPEGCGGVGVEGTFTFTSSSADVVRFDWSIGTDAGSAAPGTPVKWTPTSSGPRRISVRALDRAGLPASTEYDFYVAAPASIAGCWLEESTTDCSGNGHDLVVTGTLAERPGRVVGGQSAYGFADAVASTGKVLATDRSFAVTTWVKLTGDTDQTVISQPGFRLGYDSASHKWVFSPGSALSDAPAAPGAWTHLIGVYDAARHEARLYVNGKAQQPVAATATDAPGDFQIGSAWRGDVSEVKVWNRTLTAAEIAELTTPWRVGKWLFNEGSGDTAYDFSQFWHDLSLTGGAGWGEGSTGPGLRFTGPGSADTAEPVLYTDQSYTVDVWVKLAEAGTARTIVVQRGPSEVDPFVLRYDGARWSFDVSTAPSDPTWASAKADAAIGTWTHLTATYDAAARTVKLSVNGELKSTVTDVTAWNSEGVFSVGESWLGGIDELNVYQGTL
ncbi:hypothetical protein Lesp02_68250 [Lentzea sp. NBRC 105346]|uniref:LamG-like jellyroll fold domain-containing protein n=1 Tax=Lentzea sp. NBRC 105346 TaxID=3032205 RepID=UPI0024A0CA31|nr:LamG-like jellyroll fold domain-containing protein [Lentzea sp. NBRC 105346]GLZ34638.1 hypothetical protein Lesp02_68250 [Lentzea sp. NBRC 105346]